MAEGRAELVVVVVVVATKEEAAAAPGGADDAGVVAAEEDGSGSSMSIKRSKLRNTTERVWNGTWHHCYNATTTSAMISSIVQYTQWYVSLRLSLVV